LKTYQPYLASQDAEDACVIVLEGKMVRSMNIMQPFGPGGTYVNGCLRPRQVGSAIKPFFTLLAFHTLNRNKNTQISDEPVDYFLDNGGKYAPKNFDMQYHGTVTIGEALGSSLNIPAIKTLNAVGVDKAYGLLRTIGQHVHTREQRKDDPNLYGLALGLGVKEISPLDFALMWTIFQEQTDPAFEYLAGDIIQVREILSTNAYRLLSFPQENRFDLPGTYAKSGTSRNFVDGRVCGGKKNFTVCVRVGNYSAKSMKES
jgi:penicillin-binding protein 1C